MTQRDGIDPSAIDEELARAFAASRASWPEVDLPMDVFVAHVAAKAPFSTELAALTELHLVDLYLACACARSDKSAITAFEKSYFSDIAVAHKRRTDLRILADDLKQIIRQRLLVAAPGQDARIADYSGRGSLRNWFRVAVVRVISNLAARPTRELSVRDEALAAFPILTADPELEYMKRLYRAQFEAALIEAFTALDRRERSLLRHSLVDSLTIDQLAVVHGVHRATVARWLVGARDALFNQLRTALMQKLKIDKAEFGEILRLVQSRFDITIERLFRDTSPEPEPPDRTTALS